LIVHAYVAAALVPPAFAARTWKVWSPGVSRYVFGLVHTVNAVLSMLHSSGAAGSASVNENVALVLSVGFAGELVIDGVGAGGGRTDHV
jgi:hypothetical protein